MENKIKRVFIADDDEAIVDATSLMLEVSGYEVAFTFNGGEVVKALEQNKPDLLLLDIWMSGIDGRNVCRDIKANPTTKDIPVLMISASRDIKDSALQSGADDFVAKPFDMKVLIEKIERLTCKEENFLN